MISIYDLLLYCPNWFISPDQLFWIENVFFCEAQGIWIEFTKKYELIPKTYLIPVVYEGANYFPFFFNCSALQLDLSLLFNFKRILLVFP